jgi:CheY-like chemotaxis protein/Tfp pilus assembly protein PilF
MNLESQLTALKNQNRDLTLTQRAELSCQLSKQFEKAGEYEAAREALSEFWPERDGLAKLDGLDEPMKAEVTLRLGALAGWLGSAHQAVGGQETAKNLITQSIQISEKLGESRPLAEAHKDLAICYFREGSFDEARIHLRHALTWLKDENSDLRAVIMIWFGLVEGEAGRLHEALRVYNNAAPLVEKSEDHIVKGAFHNQFGLVFRRLAAPENREDYLDRALIEYAAASFHFEQAENVRNQAGVENNLGFLFFTIGRYKDAHYHLDRARYLFLELKDVGTAAQVDETRARTLLAEGRIVEAERMVRSAVKTLETGGQQAVLAEALTTQGIVLARLGNHPRAKAVLERAVEVAETTGDLEGAGRAKLSIIEELGEKIPAKELVSIYRSAIDLLKRSQDPSTGKRLISCAAALLDVLGPSENEDLESLEHTWEGFSFKRQVLKYEKVLIERALRDAGGSVTRAARLLGFNHHQSLISLINSRHMELLKTRTAVRKRRRHLFSEPRKIKKKLTRALSEVCVLHVEVNKTVARLIQDTLAAKGVYVDSCASGTTALEILKTDARYDVLIVDNDLPGLSGLELVLRVRSMARRRGTPIIMLAEDNCEREAWRAGVDAFLRKPDSVDQVSSTIDRLLKERKEKRK